MTTVTLETESGELILSGATRADDSGGWNAPDKRTERGFSYDSYVDREPIDATLEATVDGEDLEQLRNLRDQSEPLAASIGSLSISSSSLDNLDVTNDGQSMYDREAGEYVSSYQVTLTISEVREAEIESAEISIDTEAGAMGSAAAGQEASFSYPEDNDGGSTEEETGGIVGTLSGIKDSLAGVF